MSDAICSRPGCTDPSVGKVDSKAPIFKYKPRPGAVGGELIQKPPGEICFEHLRDQFPDMTADEVEAWLNQQLVEARKAKKREACARSEQDRLMINGTNKRSGYRTGVILRERDEL